ncbi:MAG: chemotaxis protein CheW [Cyanobacteria bacterium P01_B01_bin.77]
MKKYISFQVASYWYVIPVTEILKVVNCPPPSQGGVVGLGVVQLGPHTIQLLDLEQLFGSEAIARENLKSTYLVVLQRQENTLWGIALGAPPDLVELSSAVLKPFALAEHGTSQNPWISHVGVISEQTCKRTYLQLDLDTLLQPKVDRSILDR